MDVSKIGIEAIQVEILNFKLLKNVISIYCSNSVRIQESDWDSIFYKCCTNSMILGDFNGHHVIWSYKTDRKGKQLFDSTLNNNCISLKNAVHVPIL